MPRFGLEVRVLHVLTFLGTGEYLPITYEFPGGFRLSGTAFPRLLVRYLAEVHPDGGQGIQVHLALTALAHQRWGGRTEEILEGGAGELGAEAGARVAHRWGDAVHVPLQDGATPDQLWENLRRLVEAVPAGSRLVLDITHAFRSIPVQAMAAVSMMSALRGIHLEAVYYGAFEAGSTDPLSGQRLAPVFDLTQFVTASAWTNALESFQRTGNPAVLAGMLEAESGASPDRAAAQEWSRRLDKAGRQLELARAPALLETLLRMRELQGRSRPEQALGRLDGPLPELVHGVIHPLVGLVKDQTGYPSGDLVTFCFALLEHYFSHDRLMQATALMRETMVTICIASAKPGVDRLTDRIARENCERLLGCLEAGVLPGTTEEPSEGLARIGAWWRDMRPVRNNAMHCGFSSRQSGRELGKDLHDLMARLLELRPIVDEQGPRFRELLGRMAEAHMPSDAGSVRSLRGVR